jgi:hypothetical protein
MRGYSSTRLFSERFSLLGAGPFGVMVMKLFLMVLHSLSCFGRGYFVKELKAVALRAKPRVRDKLTLFLCNLL